MGGVIVRYCTVTRSRRPLLRLNAVASRKPDMPFRPSSSGTATSMPSTTWIICPWAADFFVQIKLPDHSLSAHKEDNDIAIGSCSYIESIRLW